MRTILILITSFFLQTLSAQQIIIIQSDKYAIVLQNDQHKRLRQVYFGQKLTDKSEYAAISQTLRYNGTNEDVFNHCYTPSGTWNIAEPALQVVHADGNPSTELEYVTTPKSL